MTRPATVLLLILVAATSYADHAPPLGYITELSAETDDARHERRLQVAARRARTVIMVHRGASRFAPENTLEACKAAMDRGADGVEIDIRRTKDGVLVLMHDETVDRTLEGSGKVAEMTYAQIVRLPYREALRRDAADASMRTPTFAAFLALARQRAALIHLDIKDPGCEGEIIRLLNKADLWPHIVEVNNYNADRIRADERLKLLRYKGWFPDDARDEPTKAKPFMQKPGEMVFIKDDPAPVVRLLERERPEAVGLPKGIRKRAE